MHMCVFIGNIDQMLRETEKHSEKTQSYVSAYLSPHLFRPYLVPEGI